MNFSVTEQSFFISVIWYCISGMLIFIFVFKKKNPWKHENYKKTFILSLMLGWFPMELPFFPFNLFPEKCYILFMVSVCSKWSILAGSATVLGSLFTRIYTFKFKLMAGCALSIWFPQSADKTFLLLKEIEYFFADFSKSIQKLGRGLQQKLRCHTF